MKTEFRLDLADQDEAFIWEALNGFAENASNNGLSLVSVQMNKSMFDKLDIKNRADDPALEGASIIVCDAEFEDTIELRYGSNH